jgi:HlyD family secretion protein
MNKNETRRALRRFAPYIAAAVVIVLLALGFRPVPVLVDADPITRGHLAVTVEDEGRTRVADRYVVSAPLVAQARRITLQVGDRVKAGQVLVTLDATAAPIPDVRAIAEARARVDAARATLATAQQEAEAQATAARLAQDEYQRARRLHAENFISTAQIDQAKAGAERTAALARSAEFRVRTAKSELEVAQAALAYAGRRDPKASGVIRLRAPVAGQVLVRHFESERVVQPGQAILEIGNPERLEVEVDVLSADAVRIAPGMRVLFERWGDPEPLEGRVRRIEPHAFTRISALGVEEQRVWVIADITSPPEQWARLGDGYRVNARFILWEADKILRVPTAALFRHGDGWAVFVVEQNRAQLRPVKIGRRGALLAELLEGAAEGERVIVHPDREIEDGTRIRLHD